jgi:transglutaminase-like putative cysteine protease
MEEQMKKKLILLLVLSLVLTSLVGCKKDDTKPAEAPATETETKTETASEAKPEEKATEAKEADVMSGTMTEEFDLSNHEAKESVRLWIPVAQSDEYQDISNMKVTVNGEDSGYEINEDDLGNKMIYVEWKPEDTERKVTYSFDVTRKEALRPEIKDETAIDANEFAQYLADSKLLNISGNIREKAMEITKDKESVYDKERAIYDWIYDNMERNNDVVGCGTGDVENLLKTLNGKCTDIGSVFIAMSRAIGVPARETFGVRMSKDDKADMTKGQHCWVEYYQPGTGWFPIDIADVLKGILTKECTKDSQEALDLKDYFWGNFDANRVGFTTGRDLTLTPAQNEGPLNQFGYPYAEVDGTALDFYNPAEFVYTITYTK